MKRYILIIFIPFFINAQSSYDNNEKFLYEDKRSVGCVDLDEALIDLISIFGTPSFLESLLIVNKLDIIFKVFYYFN